MTTMIVPVWISSKSRPKEEIVIYALMDTQSDTSFIAKSVGEQLSKGWQTALKISTMTAKQKSSMCTRYNDVQIRGLHSEAYISIPEVFSRGEIPAEWSHIRTPSAAQKWNHLWSVSEKISLLQDCPIALLIGYNCPEALRPLHVQSGTTEEHYAI